MSGKKGMSSRKWSKEEKLKILLEGHNSPSSFSF